MENKQGFVKIKFYYWHEGEEADRIESMWATAAGGNYKIENIPFYVMSYAYGDLVNVVEKDGELFVDGLAEESGHSTVRLVFFDKSIIEFTRKELKELGCDSEVSDKSFLIAVDVPPAVDYQSVVKPYLDKGFNNDLWDYQEACLSSKHGK